jgi:NACHT domain
MIWCSLNLLFRIEASSRHSRSEISSFQWRCSKGWLHSDVQQLRAKLNRKVPQGWLISDRRISAEARQRVKKDDTLRVFSLSELLQTMIWGPYIAVLDELVTRDRIPEFYVDLHCYKLQMGDGDTVLSKERHSSLDSYIDEWLSERGKMHISLLAEFGAGKTWFCRHYANLQLARFLNNPAKERLPLLITLRMFSKATTAQQLINDVLLEQYQLPFIGSAYEVFQRLNLSGKLLLILDGFDEMARKVDYQTVVDNFWELAKLVEDGSKVILTSRTEYFRWAKESEKIFGGEEFGRRTILLQPPRFEVLYLEPLSDPQIRDVIAKRTGSVQGALVADKIMSLLNLAEMARKPVLLELLLVALKEVSSDALKNPTQVYLYATNKLLLRNITAEKTFTSTSDKVFFLCELACEMLKTNELRMHYRSIPERIKSYFGDRIADQHELDSWDYDLRAQTLLHRDAAGYYEFAHKSLAEYFVALKFAAEIGCLDHRFLSAYTEGDEQPGKLTFMEHSLDVSRFPLPPMNFEVATELLPISLLA